MSKYRKSNNNTDNLRDSIMITFIVLATILLVGGAGLMFNGYLQSYKTTSNTITSPETPNPVNQSSLTPITTITTMDIKEFGFKLTVSPDLSDLVYTVQPIASDGTLSLGISELSLEQGCGTNALGLIVRLSKPVLLGNAITPDNKTVFKFGNYYYAYVQPQNLCMPDSSGKTTSIEDKITSFSKVFATAQLDN